MYNPFKMLQRDETYFKSFKYMYKLFKWLQNVIKILWVHKTLGYIHEIVHDSSL